MRLDTAVPFGELYDTEEAFKEAMLSISRHRISRDVAAEWATNLRYLTPAAAPEEEQDATVRHASPDNTDSLVSPDPSSSGEASDDFCACSYHPDDYFSEESHRLALTERSQFPECVHYLAVSYCWESASSIPVSAGHSTPHQYTIETRNGLRRNKVPSHVLDRVIAYARGLTKFIWIDQECIVQDDPRDQQDGIQAMDMGYQRASFCVGLLDVVIDQQRHIDALVAMYEAEGVNESQLKDLAEILELIAADR
ncbi:hypothetical protein B0A49_07964 [Cryomyces minteri]|uniref:Heterokaryon incompatibility domain-containing protein n=1 Tax=Cryomyces minteri TaxID=331657 RepID=A0A4U0WU76_9PEZI|nr:hypothetical protein B0A49_07964 [Cryomyces minteri]